MPSTKEQGKRVSGSYSAQHDSAFVDILLRSLCKDREFLVRAAPLLPLDFFDPPAKAETHEYARWIIADLAKNYYARHRQPIGAFITTRVKRYIKANNVDQLRAEALVAVADRLVKKKPVERDRLLRELVEFTSARAVKTTVRTIIDEYEGGQLSLERLREIFGELRTGAVGQETEIVDYFERDGFRSRQLLSRLSPLVGIGIGIFEIDAHMSRIGPGHVCIVMAPSARGKTLLLQHAAVHSVLYSHNAGFVTFEMPKRDIAARFDNYTTGMTHEEIAARPKRAEKRYQMYVDRVRASGGRLFIVDGEDIGGNTVAHVESFIERCKAQGHALNSLYVDYDEFFFPNVKVKDDPIERYNLLYLEIKRMAVQHHLTFWTAAQTQRGTEGHKILGMDKAAQDIGKIRKADFVCGIGNGADYDDLAVYPHIIKNRHGAAGFGQYCITDKQRAMIIDIEATNRALRLNPIEGTEDE